MSAAARSNTRCGNVFFDSREDFNLTAQELWSCLQKWATKHKYNLSMNGKSISLSGAFVCLSKMTDQIKGLSINKPLNKSLRTQYIYQRPHNRKRRSSIMTPSSSSSMQASQSSTESSPLSISPDDSINL